MEQNLTPQERSHLAMASTVFGPGKGGYGPIIEQEQREAEAMLNSKIEWYPSSLYRKPCIGDVVVFFPNPVDDIARANTAKVCPAIITRIWGPTGTCNLKLIPDHAAMQDRGSVSHKSGNIAGYSWCFQEEFEEGVNRGLWPASEF